MLMTTRGARLLGLGLLLLVNVGCLRPEPPHSFIFGHNTTASALTFEMELPNLTIALTGQLAPGATGPIISIVGMMQGRLEVDDRGCTPGVVIARDTASNEVARHDPGLCVGDTWEIGGPGSS